MGQARLPAGQVGRIAGGRLEIPVVAHGLLAEGIRGLSEHVVVVGGHRRVRARAVRDPREVAELGAGGLVIHLEGPERVVLVEGLGDEASLVVLVADDREAERTDRLGGGVPVERVFPGVVIDLVSVENPQLVTDVLSGPLELPVPHVGAFDGVDGIAVGLPRRGGIAGPPGPAGRSVDMFIEGEAAGARTVRLGRAVDIVAGQMGVADHQVRLLELLQQGQHVIEVLFVGIAEGLVGAEDDHLAPLVRHGREVLLQPFELGVRETAVVAPGPAVALARSLLGLHEDVVHHDDMHVPPVERVVGGTELLDIGRRGGIVVGLVVGGVAHAGVMVMVADGLEERDMPARGGAHVGHGVPHRRPHVAAVIDNVAQGHRIDVGSAGERGPDVGHRLVRIALHFRRFGTLRVADPDKGPRRLLLRQRRQGEIRPDNLSAFGGYRLVKQGNTGMVRLGFDPIVRRGGIIDETGPRVRFELVHAVRIGLDAGVSVGDGDARDAVSVRRAGDAAGEVVALEDQRTGDGIAVLLRLLGFLGCRIHGNGIGRGRIDRNRLIRFHTAAGGNNGCREADQKNKGSPFHNCCNDYSTIMEL